MARLPSLPRILAQVLRCVAQFSLADHLAEGARSSRSIAAAARLNEHATHRLLRYCATVGLAEAHADGTYSGTALLATLRSDDSRALRSFAIAQNGPGQWALLDHLDDALRTGLPQAEAALGCSLYDYYALPEHAEEAAAYRAGLAGVNSRLETELAGLVGTRGLESVLDVGGSDGSMVMALMAANPELRGAVLDLPVVEPIASANARSRGLADRFEFIGGDFFDRIPASRLYLLKNVLGNWSNEQCRKILDNCCTSARPGSRWIILENAIDETNPTRWSVDIDIVTMVAVGGETRRVVDYRQMLEQCGLTFTGSAAVSRSITLIEAVYR
jgi:O-methyltransferase domain